MKQLFKMEELEKSHCYNVTIMYVNNDGSHTSNVQRLLNKESVTTLVELVAGHMTTKKVDVFTEGDSDILEVRIMAYQV
jgi:hypothetical protein